MKSAILLLSLAAGALLWAADETKMKPITVTGTVVDTGCYMVHDGIGTDHKECATTCAKKGIPPGDR